MQTATPAAPSRLTTILIGSIAALAALFLVWPVWRAFFPMEIWGNEGWNAYHADEAMRGSGLYPPPDGLIANNYPPLSYYLLGWLGRVFGDPLYVGRALSLLATLAIGAAAAAVVRQFGGSRTACLIAGFWFVATMARFFEFYVGMNEPQLLNLAVMLMPRTYHFARAVSTLGRLQFILPAMVLWAIWAWHERRAKPARFTALLIGIALPLCLLQKSGAGVDENAQFELIFATTVGIGLAYDGLLRDPLRTGWSPQFI